MPCPPSDVDLSATYPEIQAAGLSLLLESDNPINAADIASRANTTVELATAALDNIERTGLLRRDDDGNVVGIAGITIVPTQHKIEIDGSVRWTWCALDAVGIIGAVGRGGRFTTTVPGTVQNMSVEFDRDGHTDSTAVVFMADGFTDGCVVDDWCPTVNLFPDSETANAWAKANNITGQPVAIPVLMPDAIAMWTFATTQAG